MSSDAHIGSTVVDNVVLGAAVVAARLLRSRPCSYQPEVPVQPFTQFALDPETVLMTPPNMLQHPLLAAWHLPDVYQCLNLNA